ncbi:unnamed protein product [Protopolystoma xenopodis]|uniref:Uncharacterized protein n=1 Tax=Protopolystoma xenopodis TaxID=117903 RepID=A0A448WJ49_9PLAT|nr:unnamed protein product [Protopolystoma xenopodis]
MVGLRSSSQMTQLLSPNSLRVDASEILSFVSASAKLGPVEASILEYVIGFHGKEAQRRSAFISLLIHAGLLARGARPYSDSASTSALLPPSWASSDPIRVSYSLTSRPKYGTLASSSSQLQMSVAETDSQIFINLTDTTTDKFGHLELSGPEQVRLDSLSDSNLLNLSSIFPHLSELVEKIEETLWKPVLPCPPVQRTVEDKKLVPIKIPDGPVSRHVNILSLSPYAFIISSISMSSRVYLFMSII